MSHDGRPAIFMDRDGTLSHEVGYVNHASRFRLYPWTVDAIRTINRAGWRRKVDDGREYLIDPNVFKAEVCAGFDLVAVCKVLVDAGCLESTIEAGKTRYSIKRRIQGESPRRVYVVTSRIWEA